VVAELGALEFGQVCVCFRGYSVGLGCSHNTIDMCITCKYVHSMAKMIQVRNVPDALHRSLKARAAMAGMSLSDYLLVEFREIAERPVAVGISVA
jgi:hypothetical protein